VIDTTTNVVVATINLAGFVEISAEIALSPDGKRLYVPGRPTGSVFTPGVIYVIDTATTSVVSHFTSPPYEYFDSIVISPDNARLYSNAYYPYSNSPVPPALGAVIAVLDPATGGVTAKIPGVMTVGVFSPDSQRLYGVGLDGIAVIDTATDVPTTAVANIPYAADLAITPDGKHLYITDHSTNSVLVADSATYTISTILPISIAGIGAIAIVSAH
jgi:YVTN family beta-propeller protein